MNFVRVHATLAAFATKHPMFYLSVGMAVSLHGLSPLCCSNCVPVTKHSELLWVVIVRTKATLEVTLNTRMMCLVQLLHLHNISCSTITLGNKPQACAGRACCSGGSADCCKALELKLARLGGGRGHRPQRRGGAGAKVWT